MYRILFLLPVFVFFLSACKKDESKTSVEPALVCEDTDVPALVSLTNSFGELDAEGASLDIWTNGWVVLNLPREDRINIYNENLELQKSIPVTGVQGVVCLPDQTFLALNTERNLISNIGTPVLVDGWNEIGRLHCERLFVYGQAKAQAVVQQMLTHVYRYDTYGNQFFHIQLKGWVGNNPANVVEVLGERIFIALENRDTLETKLVYDMNVFQDSILSSFNNGELWLYELNMQGSKVLEKKIADDYFIDHFFPNTRGYLAYGKGQLWYSSLHEITGLDLQGNILDRIKNPQEACEEKVIGFEGSPNGVLILSNGTNFQNYFYELTPSSDAKNVSSVWKPGYLAGVQESDFYIVQGNQITRAGNSAELIWKREGNEPGLEAKTFKRSCSGSFYGIVRDIENKFLLSKISSSGELAPN